MMKWHRLTIIGSACLFVIAAGCLVALRKLTDVDSKFKKHASIHPLLNIPRACCGGIVGQVLAKVGDPVAIGQILLRFDVKDLETRLSHLRQAAKAAEAAVKGGDAIAQIPNQARQYLYEMHPETMRAEREYVDALAAVEQAQGSGLQSSKLRLASASEERLSVRRRLAKLFAGSANGEDPGVYLTEIAKSISEVEKLLQNAELRASSVSIVELLDALPGDRIEPGQPMAVLVSVREYSADLVVTDAELSRLHTGMVLEGRITGDGRPLQARIASITRRKLQVFARDNLQVTEEPVVHVQIESATRFPPGLQAQFRIP